MSQKTYLKEWLEFYSSLNNTLLELHKISPKHLDFNYMIDLIEKYDYIQDISANASANVESRSIPREKYELMQSIFKYLTFRRIFEKATEMYGYPNSGILLKSLIEGSLYLHDSSSYLVPYCLGVDFSRLFEEGMKDIKLVSLPPRKPKSFINQVKEAIIELSNEFAGAIAFPTLIISYTYIYLKYYGKDANLNEREIRDDFQNLIHTINKEMRNGVESPFTNMSFFDRYILDELMSYVYSHYLINLGMDKEEFIKKVMQVQEIVIRFLAEGDPVTRGPYPFPVLTANFILDENKNIKDTEFLKLISKYNTRGIFNIYCSNDARKYSMCCRFQPDYKDVRFDSFGNGGINVGSIKVVTINLNRIALDVIDQIEKISKDPQSLQKHPEYFLNHKYYLNYIFDRLECLMEQAKLILDVYRELLRDIIKQGKLKYFNKKWFDLDKNFYSTVGFIGLWEMYHTLKERFFEEGFDYEYVDFAKEILSFMDCKIKEWNNGKQVWKYNLEQVPGESLASFFPKLDKFFYGEAKVPYTLYANQFIPLYVPCSIFDKIEIEGELFPYLSGGGISHINIAEELTPEVVEEMIKKIAQSNIEHFALNPVFSICEKGHFTFGNVNQCGICGGQIKDKLTRVVGFFTRVSKWNKERREWEFPKRIWSKIN